MKTDPEMPSTDESLRCISAALRTALRVASVSNRRCERELGLSTGYLSRILAGDVQLRVGIVLDLCRMMDVPPAAFFAALFPAPPPSDAATRILRCIGAIHPQALSRSSNIEEAFALLRAAVDAFESCFGNARLPGLLRHLASKAPATLEEMDRAIGDEVARNFRGDPA